MHLQHYILGGLALAASCLRSQSAPIQTALAKPQPNHQTSPSTALGALPVSSNGLGWKDLQTPPEALTHLRQVRQERQLQQANHDSSDTFDGFHIFNERSANLNDTTEAPNTSDYHFEVSISSSVSMLITGLVCGTILGVSITKLRKACQKKEEEPTERFISGPVNIPPISAAHQALPITEAIARKYLKEAAEIEKKRLLAEQQLKKEQVKDALSEAIATISVEEPVVVVVADEKSTETPRQHLRSETSDYESLPPNDHEAKVTSPEDNQYVEVNRTSESEEVVVVYTNTNENPPPLPLSRASSTKASSKKPSERLDYEPVTLRRHKTLPPPVSAARESTAYLTMHAVEASELPKLPPKETPEALPEVLAPLYDVIPFEPVVRLQSV